MAANQPAPAELVALTDGRLMAIALATTADATAIAAAHPLPLAGTVPQAMYRRYYELKAQLYVRAPGGGIVCGRVEGKLAGFVFFTADLKRLDAFTKSPRNLLWILGQLLRACSGRPSFLWEAVRWGRQHLEQSGDYSQPGEPAAALPEIASWIGTVHTVEDFRRLGVAGTLLDRAESLLAHAGAREVALWAAEDNEPALQLYEKRNYRRLAQVPRVGEVCWLMVKGL
jgi:ribosomal protein S18 acetylase RimI-like enzyme